VKLVVLQKLMHL